MSARRDLLTLTASAKKSILRINSSAEDLRKEAIKFKEAIALKGGALAVWNPANATGRIPRDTYAVQYDDDFAVDWTQPQNHPMDPEVFDALWHDALETLHGKDRLYQIDRAVGADSRYSLEVRTITDRATTALFSRLLFRQIPADQKKSVFAEKPFTILVLPGDSIRTEKYRKVLREDKGKVVDVCIAMDFRRRLGIVYGTSYLGAVKKSLFTSMNTLLPPLGVLPVHASAVEDTHGATHLFLGLSGTGKTTLTADPHYFLIGDDEHLWCPEGIANMENGCYAKLFGLKQEKEPEIYNVTFTPPKDAFVLVENALVYPDGSVDLDDKRLTENSRVAYELSALERTKPRAMAGHPSTIIFLTADANGVLPPVAKLTTAQALLWFFLGYTSKLAGTETGITQPQSTFSRFFGGAFMPRSTDDYLTLFQSYLTTHKPAVYLVNTGWTGGAYGIGKRMDISVTRSIVNAVIEGSLEEVQYKQDPLFHLLVPTTCPGVPSAMLDPKSTWANSSEYEQKAKTLAAEFSAYFDQNCTGVLESLESHCPGK